MKLQPRLLLATAAILAILTIANLWTSYRAYEGLVDEEVAKEARDIRAMLMATRRVYHKQFIDSGLAVTYTTPMWIEAYCLKCHGKREDAPASIQQKYPESYDYQIGDLRGVLSIKIPLTTLRERVWSMWRGDAITRLGGYVLLFLTLAWLLRQTVTLRLSRLEATARQLTAGDYRQRTDQGGTDEIGTLATALNQLAVSVERRDSDLRRFSEVTAHHLQEPARRMANYAERLGTLPPACIDQPRLNDLFEVALDNALSHGRGRCPLEILIEGKRSGGRTCYYVSDNGAGVEPQYRERVFRVFERLAPAGEGSGTGIGLAILRRIAESCGGAARLEASTSGGARLIFELAIEKLK